MKHSIRAHTPEVVEKVRAELPAGLCERVAVKVLGGVLATARVLESVPAS